MVLMNSMMTKKFFNWKNKSRSSFQLNGFHLSMGKKKRKKNLPLDFLPETNFWFLKKETSMWKYYISTIGRKNNFFYPRLVSFTYHNGQTTLISDCQIPNGNNYFPIPPIPVLCVEVSLGESEGVLIQVFLLYFFLFSSEHPLLSNEKSDGIKRFSWVKWSAMSSYSFFLPAIFSLSASYRLACFMM